MEILMTEKQEIKASKIDLFFWALYDWASSAFASLIQTFVFASYFTSSVASNEIKGSYEWGFALGLSGIIIAIGGPILGAIADHKGNRKGWMSIFYLLCLISTALLWYVKPESSYVPIALILVSLGTIGSEFAFIFYNATLPDLVPKKNIGTWSGIGWGMGYFGGMMCLVLALLAFINQQQSWWMLNESSAEPVRAVFLLTAAWYGLFALPFFIFTPSPEGKKQTLSNAISLGLNQLKNSIKEIHHYRHLVRFLIARMIYTDGLTTLFLFGGVYAAGTFHMTPHEVLLFAIALNVTAGLGAFAFAWMDDFIGSRTVIIISLICLTIVTAVLLSVESINMFWTFGILLGVFVGPLQSSSRALMAKVTPKEKQNQMFGLFAFSGKATGFLGPLFVSFMTYMTSSQREGISILIPFFLCGLLLILKVPSEEKFEKL